MTDRISYLTVALSDDMRSDDVETITNAIMALRGVANVTLGAPVGPAEFVMRSRIRLEIAQAIGKIISG